MDARRDMFASSGRSEAADVHNNLARDNGFQGFEEISCKQGMKSIFICSLFCSFIFISSIVIVAFIVFFYLLCVIAIYLIKVDELYWYIYILALFLLHTFIYYKGTGGVYQSMARSDSVSFQRPVTLLSIWKTNENLSWISTTSRSSIRQHYHLNRFCCFTVPSTVVLAYAKINLHPSYLTKEAKSDRNEDDRNEDGAESKSTGGRGGFTIVALRLFLKYLKASTGCWKLKLLVKYHQYTLHLFTNLFDCTSFLCYLRRLLL